MILKRSNQHVTNKLYLDQFLLGPDLDGLHLLGCLGLNTIGIQKHLQSTTT